jgi:hypothetical protein
MAQAARMTADHTEEFLRHAENTVRLGPSLVARGILNLTTSARWATTRSACCE